MSTDSIEANRKFAEKRNFPFLLLSDAERSIAVAYGAAEDASAKHAKRISYVIGPDQTIVRAYGAVKVWNHPAEVLRDIQVET